MTKYLVTGATGQLGRLVLADLLTRVPAADVIALVRRPDADLGGLDIETRTANYDDVAALTAAFAGVDRLLLISGNEFGKRPQQHANVIDAARAAGVGFVAYTSLLKADSSPMKLAADHLATERHLQASGLAYTLLRNGWYSENMLGTLAQDLAIGQRFGAGGNGRYATATRKDFATAAAAVLAGAGHEGKTYELGGDTGVTQTELAAMISEATGKPVSYVNLPEAAYKQGMLDAGLPELLADIFADSDARAAEGWLDTDAHTLSELIGRPTEPMAETLKAALDAL